MEGRNSGGCGPIIVRSIGPAAMDEIAGMEFLFGKMKNTESSDELFR